MNISREEAKKMIGEGWGSLIDKIYDKLPQDAFIEQIKEKFGGLRFYVANVSEDVFDFIQEVEKESYTICEVCGHPGVLRENLGWILTLCNKHYEEHIHERKSGWVKK